MNEEKKLGLKELIAIGVGGMIGGGIFSVLGMAVELLFSKRNIFRKSKRV